MNERTLAELRREYAAGGLSESDLQPDPVSMFRRWLHDATAAGLHEPNAMVVSTVSPEGRPSSRIVLLKALDHRGFVFFTNYRSRKAVDLDANPSCSLLFPWHPLERQVRVEGRASRLTDAENAVYFASRPRASQIGAWASPQSEVVGSRAELDRRYDDLATRFGEGEVPLPPEWGGFRVAPDVLELWQGRRNRMHDRLRYRRPETAPLAETGQQMGPAEPAAQWTVERLAP